MNRLFRKMVQLEKELSANMGTFYLFALFQTPELSGHWDVIASASWLNRNMDGIRLISEPLVASLEEKDLLKISRVVVLEPEDPIVEQVTGQYDVEHQCLPLHPLYLDDREIEKAIIITATPTTRRNAA